MINFTSKYLLAAKVLGAKDWSAPKVLKLARHMAHNGATIPEIAEACGWKDITEMGARKRLKKFNIRWGCKLKRARCGDLTSLPPSHRDTDQRSFVARSLA